jgi:hypothetical protein
MNGGEYVINTNVRFSILDLLRYNYQKYFQLEIVDIGNTFAKMKPD